MGKLLLIVAVLGSLPSLWGVVLGAENILQENEKDVIFCEGRSNLTGWLKDDDTCPQYSGNAVKCGRGRPECRFCCDLGKDCVSDFLGSYCQCSLNPGQNCDSMCRNNPGHFPCCTYGEGACHCCLDNQICDTGDGCICDLDFCGKYCAAQEGPTTTPCCQDGKLCQCCGSSDICTDKGCSPSCDESCTSANCKSCENGVCVASCPPEQCQGWTCAKPCNQTECGATCDGTCNPATNQCESGCPGTCVSGMCPCDPAKCKLQQPCGICSGGNCVPTQCPSGTACNRCSGNCECDKTTCQGTCAQGTTACCKNSGTCTCCNQWQTCGPVGRGGFWGLKENSLWDCVCDSAKCLASECKQCDPQTQQCVSTCAKGQSCVGGKCVCDTNTCTANNCKQCNSQTGNCDPIVCGPCQMCTPGQGCQSTCSADQKCDGTVCVNKCQGVTCPYGDICLGGSCVCDSAVCGVGAGQKCQFCGSSGTCEMRTCSGDTGTGCETNSGQCMCFEMYCSEKCRGVGAPCCKLDRSGCVCCPQGQYCAAPGRDAARGTESRGNSSSLERAGVCTVTDKCAGVDCPNAGEKCVDGICVCDDPTCAQNCGGVCSEGMCVPNCVGDQTCVGGECKSVCVKNFDCDAGCTAFNAYSGPPKPEGYSTGCCTSGNCVCCDPGKLCENDGFCHRL